MHIRVGCEFRYEATWPTPTVMLVQPHPDYDQQIVYEDWQFTPDLTLTSFHDIYNNHSRRFLLPTGVQSVRYDALVKVADSVDEVAPEAEQMPVETLPDDVLHYLLPSRFCQSDVLSNTAWQLFGQTAPGWARVQAICDWVHNNIRFQYGTSTPLTDAVDIYLQRVGVCRDFTQLAVTFCRALNIPTRYVFGYIPDIDVPPPDAPMDFCAWMEVYLSGRWWTFDPRNNTPRVGRVLIGRGRDALDVAMITTYGSPLLQQMIVWADEEVPGASSKREAPLESVEAASREDSSPA
ncbi:MAG TPA: transglutaminase family protein [Ktedonobacteraceae bacterium]